MFNIGFSEMIIIGIIVILVIGPDKMPDFFRTASKWLVKIRRSTNDIKNTFQDEFHKIAGDEAKELKNLTDGINLKKRVDLDTLEKYMEDGSQIFEKSAKNKTGENSPNPLVEDNEPVESTAIEQTEDDNLSAKEKTIIDTTQVNDSQTTETPATDKPLEEKENK